MDGEFYEYRDLLSTYGQYETILEEYVGEYQGDLHSLIKKDNQYGIVTIAYGSCSGCDELQACATQEDYGILFNRIESSITWLGDDPIEKLKTLIDRAIKQDWDNGWNPQPYDEQAYVDALQKFIDVLTTSKQE